MARPWARSTKISLTVWVVVVLLQVAAVGATYVLCSGPYVTTSNAQVDGDRVQINAPADGVLIKWDISQGTVTARVPTTAIDDVRLGAPVDLAVDAYPHATVTGVVSEIQSSTAGEFDIYPSPDQNTQNPQRVKQWVPVKVTFTGTGGAAMLPGLSVTARIHKGCSARSPWARCADLGLA